MLLVNFTMRGGHWQPVKLGLDYEWEGLADELNEESEDGYI